MHRWIRPLGFAALLVTVTLVATLGGMLAWGWWTARPAQAAATQVARALAAADTATVQRWSGQARGAELMASFEWMPVWYRTYDEAGPVVRRRLRVAGDLHEFRVWSDAAPPECKAGYLLMISTASGRPTAVAVYPWPDLVSPEPSC